MKHKDRCGDLARIKDLARTKVGKRESERML